MQRHSIGREGKYKAGRYKKKKKKDLGEEWMHRVEKLEVFNKELENIKNNQK